MHKRKQVFVMKEGFGEHGHDPEFGDRFFAGPAGFGPGGFGGGPFFMRYRRGPGGMGGPRGRRMRRGNVRAAILLLLEEEPRNGYQVMQEIEQRSEGAWRPSPGSVYPAFQLLADEGLVRGESRDGGNVFELTDAGRAYVEENREKLGNPWQQAGEGMPEGAREVAHLMMQVAIASKQVLHHGSDAQRAEAAKVLAEARRSLYRILAEDDE